EDRCVPTMTIPVHDHGDSFHLVNRYSLRDAIYDSNHHFGQDDVIIQLDTGVYGLSLPNATDPNTHQVVQDNDDLRGDLDITNNLHTLIIQGNNVNGVIQTAITAADLQDRLFQVVSDGTQVIFRDLILAGGLARDDGSNNVAIGTTPALGGAILAAGT